MVQSHSPYGAGGEAELGPCPADGVRLSAQDDLNGVLFNRMEMI